MRLVSSAVNRSAAFVYAALTAQVFSMAAVVVFEQARGRRLAQQIAAFGGNPDAPGAHQVVGAVTTFAILMMALVAATIIAGATYMSWLRRVSPDPSLSSVLTSWLVPGVNLVMPPILADAAWQHAGRGRAGRARWLLLVSGWWLSSLAAISMIVMRLPVARPSGGHNLTGLGLAELLLVVVAALLCAATVKEITVYRPKGRPYRLGADAAHRLRVRTGWAGAAGTGMPQAAVGLPDARRRADVGVGGESKTVTVLDAAAAHARTGGGDLGQQCSDGVDAAIAPQPVEVDQVPAVHGAQRDGSGPGTPDHSPGDEQPRAEHGGSGMRLHRLEERQVDRTG
jgi:hypothetical protein